MSLAHTGAIKQDKKIKAFLQSAHTQGVFPLKPSTGREKNSGRHEGWSFPLRRANVAPLKVLSRLCLSATASKLIQTWIPLQIKEVKVKKRKKRDCLCVFVCCHFNIRKNTGRARTHRAEKDNSVTCDTQVTSANLGKLIWTQKKKKIGSKNKHYHQFVTLSTKTWTHFLKKNKKTKNRFKSPIWNTGSLHQSSSSCVNHSRSKFKWFTAHARCDWVTPRLLLSEGSFSLSLPFSIVAWLRLQRQQQQQAHFWKRMSRWKGRAFKDVSVQKHRPGEEGGAQRWCANGIIVAVQCFHYIPLHHYSGGFWSLEIKQIRKIIIYNNNVHPGFGRLDYIRN